MLEKGLNLKVIELKNQITDIVINSKLPITVANLVVQDFAVTMQKSTEVALNNEIQAYNEKVRELEENKENEE